MPQPRRSPRYKRLQALLVQRRKEAQLTQVQLAERLKLPQPYVSKYESGERRLDVVELLEVVEAIGCDLVELVQAINAIPRTKAKS